jgi:hypothetical protein
MLNRRTAQVLSIIPVVRVIIQMKKSRRLHLAKHAGAYKSAKRRKELLRQKKQEEKRQRRFKKEDSPQENTDITHSEGTANEQGN